MRLDTQDKIEFRSRTFCHLSMYVRDTVSVDDDMQSGDSLRNATAAVFTVSRCTGRDVSPQYDMLLGMYSSR